MNFTIGEVNIDRASFISNNYGFCVTRENFIFILLYTVEFMITFKMFSIQTPSTNCPPSLSVVSSKTTPAVSATRTDTTAFVSGISSSYTTSPRYQGRVFSRADKTNEVAERSSGFIHTLFLAHSRSSLIKYGLEPAIYTIHAFWLIVVVVGYMFKL